MYELEIFCRNIRYLRLKNNYSLTKMSKVLGVSITTLRKIEAENVPKYLSSAVVLRAAVHFNIRASSLFLPLYSTGDNP